MYHLLDQKRTILGSLSIVFQIGRVVVKIGYVRPLFDECTVEEQIEKLHEAACEEVFVEAHASAKRRVALEELLSRVERGDTVVVLKLAILADSTQHLVELLTTFSEKGVALYSLLDNLDTNREGGYAFFDVVKRLAQFQRDIMSERTKEGLEKAKKRGAQPGRPRIPDENVRRAIKMYHSKKYSLKEIREKTGISKSTLYRYLER